MSLFLKNCNITVIYNLKIYQRRIILLLFDSSLIIFSNWLTFNLINRSFENFLNLEIFNTSLLLCFIGLPIYLLSGQYKGLTRYVGSKYLYYLSIRNLFLCIINFFINILLFNQSFELLLSFSITFWFLLTSLSGFFRFGLRDFLLNINSDKEENIKRILIYGTGSESVQLFASLKLNQKYKVQYFVDDNPNNRERYLDNIKIISQLDIERVYKNIDKVLIASSFRSKKDRRNFLQILEKLDLPVLEITPLNGHKKRKIFLDSFKPLNIEELIARETEDLTQFSYKNKIIKNKVVLVTGGGGSIGSELCRKIILLKPKLLIIIENNEANLYAISNELFQLSKENNFKFVLGSIGNKSLLKKVIKDNKVDMIFHAAAYKHVPLVENNPIEGIKNNVIYTRLLCQLSINLQVKHMILISTDKAVRPTNIMGASKRLAEIIFQNYASRYKAIKPTENNTIFAMVRFGNVIGSSGSVLPLFQKQILNGGPITLTNPDIVRYFMTIPEAANLVLEASALAKGGELFLLDMGEPIKIKYVAEQLIRLNGLRVKTKNFPKGDIEIKIIGLRPGEKLYEELLIDGESERTSNDLIYKAKEKFLYSEELWPKLDTLSNLCDELNVDKTLNLLRELVPEWSIKTN